MNQLRIGKGEGLADAVQGGNLVHLTWRSIVRKGILLSSHEIVCWAVNLPSLEILNSSNSSLGIYHHFRKEITEARLAKLCISRTIQISVIYGLTIGGDP